MDGFARVEEDPVPEKIRSAERWRVAGEKLRAASPEVFANLLMLLVASCVSDDDADRQSITESYFLT